MPGYRDDTRFPWDGDRVDESDYGLPRPECGECGVALLPHECGVCDACGAWAEREVI